MATAAAEKRLRRLQHAAEHDRATLGSPARRSARRKQAPKPQPSETAAPAERVARAGEVASSNKKGRARPAAVEESHGRKKKKGSAEPEGSESAVAASFDGEEGLEEETEGNAVEEEGEVCGGGQQQKRKAYAVKRDSVDEDQECSFVGDPVPDAEARERWPKRYQKKKNGSRFVISLSTKKVEDEEILMARRHFYQAKVDDCVYNLNDNAYVKAGDGEANFIGRIIEFFETTDGQLFFTAQWFYRAEDTVIKEHTSSHDKRRVFLSEDKDDNPLNCIVSKVHIVRGSPNIDLEAKEETIPPCDLYYDMSYSVAYTTFACLTEDSGRAPSESSSVTSSEDLTKGTTRDDGDVSSFGLKEEYTLLDLYSGCGAMSTGLCLGANLSGLKLQTRWAVDLNSHACASLKLNHPQTEVRNEKAEDFLSLLKEWVQLCHKFSLIGAENSPMQDGDSNSSDDEDDVKDPSKVPKGEFEVEKLVAICYGDPNNINKKGLMFKVRWKGYGPSDDTWEPAEGLSKCQERIEIFVRSGYRRNILPLPGAVDVICGGPPCQGISGFNRFRKSDNPLEDPKNQQMVVFMDIVEFLKPKYVLMENVVDILKFAKGFLGRYALSRLVSMNYQSRLGMMVAGCYGLPQFRVRVFLWGSLPSEILPQFPLPTHDVVVRGGFPNEFGQSMVAYDEDQFRRLEKALRLSDAISDLPLVTNHEKEDEMAYGRPPKTDFQRFIRLSKQELINGSLDCEKPSQRGRLYDHRPLQLNEDDYQRVCRIPKQKGANFRDLPGVIVGPDNVVQWDPSVPRVYLPSGKPLVPDYAMSFIKGKSAKPFGRLWWDETVATVVTRAEPHNQIILHPEQDRVLTIRENARLQGFPDYYQLRGPVKERYIQVGNAVAVPVARALGYALGLAIQRKGSAGPLFTLPANFPHLGGISVEPPEIDESVEILEEDVQL